jgi:hypothetical protein
MIAKKDRVTRLDYCQYLLVSQINYTLTNYAEHTEKFSHDMANRYLSGDEIRPRLVWENVKNDVRPTVHGFLVFDDTVIDKNFSHSIELVRSQYSGNAHGVIKGVGVVTCVYVNPQIDQFWIIDYRIYDPAGDGKTKLEHMQDMLLNCVYQKSLEFWAVLMDTWYATKDIMLQIEKIGKIYYCPLTSSRCPSGKIIVKWTIRVAQSLTSGWTVWNGQKQINSRVRSSKSRAFLLSIR